MSVAAIDPVSPAQLLDLAVAGDQHAFGRLLRTYDDRLRALAWRMLGDRDQMDDALQEAYVKAWRALPRFRRDADLGTWLHRITANACVDELRRDRRRPEPRAWTDTGQHPAFDGAGPERDVVAADELLRLLATLPADQRATLVLVDGEGLDHLTAARILGVAPGTVASRLFRARATLRAAAREEDLR